MFLFIQRKRKFPVLSKPIHGCNHPPPPPTSDLTGNLFKQLKSTSSSLHFACARETGICSSVDDTFKKRRMATYACIRIFFKKNPGFAGKNLTLRFSSAIKITIPAVKITGPPIDSMMLPVSLCPDPCLSVLKEEEKKIENEKEELPCLLKDEETEFDAFLLDAVQWL
jgi:hypothetical protein